MHQADRLLAAMLLAAALLLSCRSGVSRELFPAQVVPPPASTPPPSGPAGEAAEPPPFLGGFLKETRIVYPLRLAGWRAQGEQLFDEAAHGASVRYLQDKRGDRWIDVYFYPAGQLPVEVFEETARGTADEVEAATVQATGREGLVVDPLVAFEVVADAASDIAELRSRPGRSLGLTFTRQGVAYSSAMALTVHDLYFIKVRYTVEATGATRREARGTAEAFLGELLRASRVVSTGTCWRPLPFIRLAPGSSPPTDAQGTLDVDGKPGAYVYADHVAAHDPDSPAARIAMMMLMREHGRWFPGCVPPERMNPDVGQDQRELRLEYSAPSEGNGDRARRLRGQRVGVG